MGYFGFDKLGQFAMRPSRSHKSEARHGHNLAHMTEPFGAPYVGGDACGTGAWHYSMPMVEGQQQLIADSQPPVVRADSKVFYAAVRGARWTSTKFFKRRGLAAVDRWSRAYLPESVLDVTIKLLPDSLFIFPASDNYWGTYLLDGRSYEPEIEMVLRRLSVHEYTFLDGGANYGYWSVLVGSAQFGAKKAIAVEMSPTTLVGLKKNQAANGFRFDIVEAAITAEGGGEVRFTESGYHSRRSAADPVAEVSDAVVTAATVSIDQLAQTVPAGGGLLVKLDIEGYEPDAIATSWVLREHDDLVLIVEDHYKDRECSTVRTCLDVGLDVVFVDPRGAAKPITSVADALSVKTQPRVGYNFLAYSRKATGPLPTSIREAVERGQL
jgi:FkbM family methyltransferase